MKRRVAIFKIFTTCYISLFQIIVFAQNESRPVNIDTLLNQQLEELVITANRFSKKLINAPEAIGVIRNVEVTQANLRTVPEALTKMPGVFVQKTNHGGGSPFLRGLTGNQTLLLVDGIRLSNSIVRYGPTQYLNTIDVFSIDKIEILRGNGSVQYGSDALGGTIQVFTKEPEFSRKSDWGTALLLRFGTGGIEQSTNARINYCGIRTAFTGGLTWRNFGDQIGGDTTGRQKPSGYKEIDYDFKAKFLITPKTEITLALQRVSQNDVPVYHKVKLENYALYEMGQQKRKLEYIKVNHKLSAGVWKDLNFTVLTQQGEESREIQKTGSPVKRFEYDKVNTIGLSTEIFSSKGKRNRWASSNALELYHDKVNSTRTDNDFTNQSEVSKRGLYPNGATITSFAAFSTHTCELQKCSFTAGARFNTYTINIEDTTIGVVRLTPSAFVGNVAVMRKLNDYSKIFISANTGFRAPNVDDLGTLGIVDFRYELPNFNLKPEQSFQYQTGYKYSSSKIKGELYLYRNHLHNLIVRSRITGDSIEGYPLYKKENLERAFIQGIEANWVYSPCANWSISGSLTYTYGQNTTQNEPVRRIPPLFGHFVVEYKYKHYRVSLENVFAGKQDRLAKGDKEDIRIPKGGTPGWKVINIHTGFDWRFVQFNLNLNNLLNVDYRYHGSGINGAGRSALLGISIIL